MEDNERIRVTNGAISYEELAMEEKVVEQSLTGWNVRGQATTGFLSVCWWSVGPVARLVILTTTGQLIVLEAISVSICESASWKRFDLPVELGPVTCMATSKMGAMAIATEDGFLYIFGQSEGHQRFKLELALDEIISRIFYYRLGLIAVTSLGRILRHNNDQWAILLDDGVLLAGPIMELSDGSVMISKFNRLYHLVQGRITTYELPGLYEQVTTIVPRPDGALLAVGMDNQCFRLHGGVIMRITQPWQEGIDGDSDGEEEAEEEVEESEIKRILAHGVAVSDDLSVGWIAETEVRPNPRSDRTRIYLYKTGLPPLQGASNQSMFIDSLFSGENEAPILPAVKAKYGSCPVCKSSLDTLQQIRKCICKDNGHVFDICAITGQPIASLAETLQCHSCQLRVSSKAGMSKCSHCQGALLALQVSQ